MKVLGNILWFILGGFVVALSWFLLGLLLCVTIIGIPFGLQAFKVAKLCLAPFGKKVVLNAASHPIANAIWIIFFGWELALSMAVTSLILAITIIGMPIASQTVKFTKLSLFPFGAEIN